MFDTVNSIERATDRISRICLRNPPHRRKPPRPRQLLLYLRRSVQRQRTK
jgi:hypothetical protein